jgi:hypothetical protein
VEIVKKVCCHIELEETGTFNAPEYPHSGTYAELDNRFG